MREGKYWGVIKSAITTKSPKKGTPEIAITVTVTHELDGIEWAPIDNIDRVVHLYLSDGAWDRSKETLESLFKSYEELPFKTNLIDLGDPVGEEKW